MENQIKNTHYSSLGLAEIVSSPTILTYSFLEHYFSGKNSLGRAMQLVGIPFRKIEQSVLTRTDDNLLVDLCIEEETLYRDTLFTYKKLHGLQEVPKLVVERKKLLSPRCVKNTVKLLFTQSRWIANPQKVIDKARNFVTAIPSEVETTFEAIDKTLALSVWPYTLAIGVFSEFFNQLVEQEKDASLQSYISSEITQKDWFFHSIKDQEKVKRKEMSFPDYIKQYGLRADKDYELTSPRWHEIPDDIKKRIADTTDVKTSSQSPLKMANKLKSIIDTAITLQLLRSEAKRKTLLHIDALRKTILQKTNQKDMKYLTREQLLAGEYQTTIREVKQQKKQSVYPQLQRGKGRGVAGGSATGRAIHIIQVTLPIPKNAMGIFPNASLEFALQYPKCKGMIFLQGGQTSHGAIVAREYGIPSLIDPSAQGIKNGAKIFIDGELGEWKILDI